LATETSGVVLGGIVEGLEMELLGTTTAVGPAMAASGKKGKVRKKN
jgi:hypothetical protein